ncbi:MAG: tetratricopeptide repeat protein [Bacillota bacterium]|nr:tetratricopeptide repeat protein [Bacillota bacterium]
MLPNIRPGAIVFLFLLSFHPGYSQLDYFSPANIVHFADYLYQEHDFLHAAGEYQRYLFFSENPPAQDSIIFRIGLCNELAQEPASARAYYARIIRDFPESSLADAARYEMAHTFFVSGEYSYALTIIADVQDSIKTISAHSKLQFLEGASLLHMRNWGAAHTEFCKLSGSSLPASDTGMLSEYIALSNEGMNLHCKSRFFAAFSSALIPGVGKIYSGRAKDGVYSLVLIALTAWQGYEGFHRDGKNSLRGWIYGGLCGTFYLGDIYGSFIAARDYNNRLAENILDRAQGDLPWYR